MKTYFNALVAAEGDEEIVKFDIPGCRDALEKEFGTFLGLHFKVFGKKIVTATWGRFYHVFFMVVPTILFGVPPVNNKINAFVDKWVSDRADGPGEDIEEQSVFAFNACRTGETKRFK